MSSTVIDYKAEVIQKRNDYIREWQQYNDYIAELQGLRLLLEKDLQIINSKISMYRTLATEMLMAIAGYDKFIKFADGVSQENNTNSQKVEVITHIPDCVVAPPNSANGLNNESIINENENEPAIVNSFQNSSHATVGDVTSQESDISESAVKTEVNQVKSGKTEEYPLLDLLSSNGNDNDTKTVGRKAKYRLKQEYVGLGIAKAAESFMSQTPGQKYHVNALVDALYDGVNDSNALGIYKTVSTQLSMASKKKGRIKKHSNKGTYYYS